MTDGLKVECVFITLVAGETESSAHSWLRRIVYRIPTSEST